MSLYFIKNFEKASHTVKQICLGLVELQILHFSFMRSHDDGRFVNLSNLDGWLTHYYSQKLYYSSWFENHPSAYHSTHFVWDNHLKTPVIEVGEKEFNSYHGLVIVDRKATYTNFFFFSTDKMHSIVLNQYINHMDSLYQFTQDFERLTFIEKHTLPCKALLYETSYFNNPLPLDVKKDLLNKSAMPSLQTNNPAWLAEAQLLTDREYECLFWLMRGYSSKEIAKNLHNSPRTVEFHVNNMKEKFNCKTSIELVCTLYQNYAHLIRFVCLNYPKQNQPVSV